MISVCVATYNGAEYIEPQLQSILSQLAPTDEVIVSDDGSSDGTPARIEALHDPRIRVITQSHVGATQNFYATMEQAQGEYIFLADQDDVWLPNKVARNIELLQGYDLVVCDARVTDAALHEISPSLFRQLGSREGLIKNWLFCTFYGSSMAFRRSVLEAAKPFPKGKYMAHDWWIGMVAEMTGRVLFLPEPMILYRRHGGNVTELNNQSVLTRSSRSLRDKIGARLQMAYYMIRYRITRQFQSL